MIKLFNNIVVPVRFSRDTEQIIEKAIGFANSLQCNLHLLHITTPPLLPSLFSKANDLAEKKYSLLELQATYYQKINPGLMIYTHFVQGSTEKVITDYVLTNNIDTILWNLPRRKFRFFNFTNRISQLAKKTGCSVLTVRPGALSIEPRAIILPIGTSLPINKIRVTTYLAKQFNASVHLVALDEKSGQADKLSYLKKTFQVLKDNTDLHVVCKSLSDGHSPETLLKYAHSVDAGLIVINPEQETTTQSPVQRMFPAVDLINSGIPVITVS
jgi:K+-sensing histidine kinase KdpD